MLLLCHTLRTKRSYNKTKHLLPFFMLALKNSYSCILFPLWLAFRFCFCPALNVILLWEYICVLCDLWSYFPIVAYPQHAFPCIELCAGQNGYYQQLISLRVSPIISLARYMRITRTIMNSFRLWISIVFSVRIWHLFNLGDKLYETTGKS